MLYSLAFSIPVLGQKIPAESSTVQFLPHDAMLVQYMLSYCDCQSISHKLEVTNKTAKCRIMETTPHNIRGTTSFLVLKILVKFELGHPNRGAIYRWGELKSAYLLLRLA